MPTNKGADHWLLRQYFARIGMNDVSNRLLTLHNWRKQVDYDNVVPSLIVKVRDAIRLSAAVIRRV